MNKHLQSVRTFHERLNVPQAVPGESMKLSDMEIIKFQSLLMEAGSELLKAIKAGEMAEILLGLIDLAYVALAALARQGADIVDQPIEWRLDGFVLSVMRIVSDKINDCSSGEPDNYSAVYCLCVHLSRGFVNADFDKAFQCVELHALLRLSKSGESLYDDTEHRRTAKLKNSPDLSECLYE
ncbi:MAG: hypothetical protein HOP23_07955 [Methylococcaceae bacterium]|nr:hypothetical protein [Methylococcaceae bacterium]